ncbi:MAG: hypothetical protein PHN69_03495 [Candidatus Pacebacteria bacterium]|nr:hypothetical protein [Candidatus Paceibacterota bacterium]
MILKLIKKIIDLLKNNRKDEHIFIKESDINIFNKYQSQKFKDERKAECPYCFKQLYKIPGAKTKCPHCNNYMLVRTNTNNVRTVVTLTEANKIDNDWSIINGQEIRLSNNTNQIFEWKKGEKSFVNNFMKMVGNFCKITENDIFVRRQKLNNIDDTLWSLSQEYLLNSILKRNTSRKT